MWLAFIFGVCLKGKKQRAEQWQGIEVEVLEKDLDRKGWRRLKSITLAAQSCLPGECSQAEGG